MSIDIPKTDVNVLDAAARGTGEGLHLMLNVIAMLIAFIALIAMVNGGMGWVHGHLAWFPGDLQTVLGWVGRPVAWVAGRPLAGQRRHRRAAGHPRRAQRVHRLCPARRAQGRLDPRSFTIASFALAGLRQLQLDRDPDRRHRRAGAGAQARSGPARASAPCSPARSPTSSRPRSRGCCCERHRRRGVGDRGSSWAAGRPDIAIVLGSGAGHSPSTSPMRCAFRTADSRLSRAHRCRPQAASWWPARSRAAPVLAQSGRFHMYEGHPAGASALPVRVFADARHRHR